jgi:hypothetical protein
MDKKDDKNTELGITLEKHRKYKKMYKPNCLYWGLGIENEVYLEAAESISINKNDILTKHKQERYSLDYYKNYKPEFLQRALQKYVGAIDCSTILLPRLLNSHSFTKTDIYNNSATLYTSSQEKNPDFIGETMLETLQRRNPYFVDNEKWLFDGDTIEFVSTNFFNTNLHEAIRELMSTKAEFIYELNKTLLHSSPVSMITIMKENYAVAKYMTNSQNVAIFNNGTLHYNITLPTQLNSRGEIADWNKFVNEHQRAIRAIQWMEPFLIALYGAPDPFSSFEPGFSKSSQRCSVSRYISIGTYNSDVMERGKILTKPLDKIVPDSKLSSSWWYNKLHSGTSSAYVKLDELGMDVNFNKHFNHGIELRFFDYIVDSSRFYESFEFIIYLMDFVLDSEMSNSLENPIFSSVWNDVVYRLIMNGKDALLSSMEVKIYSSIFSMNITKTCVSEIYYEIFQILKTRYSRTGSFSKYVLSRNGEMDMETILSPIHKIMVPPVMPPVMPPVVPPVMPPVMPHRDSDSDKNEKKCCIIM